MAYKINPNAIKYRQDLRNKYEKDINKFVLAVSPEDEALDGDETEFIAKLVLKKLDEQNGNT
jgi:hypothetical protein